MNHTELLTIHFPNLSFYHLFKATSTSLCSTILDVIGSIYHQDNANYFILEPQCTLSQFTEKIHIKAPEIQVCNQFWYIINKVTMCPGQYIVIHLVKA